MSWTLLLLWACIETDSTFMDPCLPSVANISKIRLMFKLSLFTKIFAMLYTIHKDVELYSMLVKSNLEFSSSYYYILFALQTRVSHSHVNYPLIREY